jgi:dTDP-glucose 4,6-dehydratase
LEPRQQRQQVHEERGRDRWCPEPIRALGGQPADPPSPGVPQPHRGIILHAEPDTLRRVSDSLWTGPAVERLQKEVGDVYAGRTVLVTGADGFMGSHLTDALVELGATVHAFVRATSSGALNNIGHLRGRLTVHFADLTDKTSVDYLIRELKESVSDRPYVFHLGAQAHVGESWHRPYETVMANTVGTLNLLQSVVDHRLELEKFDTAGTSEEYGNVREAVSHHHDFDEAGGLILHERSPLNPKSIYATAKVAADFLTMNYHDAFGVPGVVTRMFNNYGPRQNPRYVTGTIITQALTRPTIELGQLEPMRDFCFCTDGVRGHLTVAAHGIPGDVYVYGQGENISMRDWVDLILRVGEEHGFWPGDREVVSTPARFRPGASEVMALRVGHDKLTRETGWTPEVSWEDGVLSTIRWYAENRQRWLGRVDWLPTGTAVHR